MVAKTLTPDLLFQSHSAPLGLVFYDGKMFPPEYQGDAIVALHGSWNASEPTGYKVVRVPFKEGKPQGYYENFLTGFWLEGQQPAQVWGRPAGLAVAADGSLLIADDAGGAVWRVSYRKP
jgi:glucose/arabinose dehydrogenase